MKYLGNFNVGFLTGKKGGLVTTCFSESGFQETCTITKFKSTDDCKCRIWIKRFLNENETLDKTQDKANKFSKKKLVILQWGSIFANIVTLKLRIVICIPNIISLPSIKYQINYVVLNWNLTTNTVNTPFTFCSPRELEEYVMKYN